MAKKKVLIDKQLLIDTIAYIEGGEKPPKTMNELYERVGKELNVPPGSVLGRIRDYGLETKTKPARIFEKQEKVATPLPAPSNDGLDLSPFTKRGVKVETLGDLMTSAYRTAEENRNIRDAWAEVRRTCGVPKPQNSLVD